MRVGNATLADELPKTVFMNPSGHFRRNADLAYPTKPIKQRLHMIGLRGGRSIPHPCERRCVERLVGNEQCIELSQLRREKASEQRICGSLACPGAPGNGGALNDRRRRQNDLRGPQRGGDAGDNRRAAIGAPGGLRRRAGVGGPTPCL